jgi:hypothetical protein
VIVNVFVDVFVLVGLGPGVLLEVFVFVAVLVGDDVFVKVDVEVRVAVVVAVIDGKLVAVSVGGGGSVADKVATEVRVDRVAVRVGMVGVTSGRSLGSCNSNRLPM